MKEITKEIKEYILSLNLFSKKGNKFFYQYGNVCIEINIEKSRFNLPGQEAFWLNILGYIISEPPLKSFSEKNLLENGHLIFVERTSVLWGSSFEQYMIYSNEDHKLILKDIKFLFHEHVIPFCHQMKSREDLIQFLEMVDDRNNRNKYSLGIAIVLAKMGDLIESKSFFQGAEGEMRIVKQIAGNFGVDLNDKK